MKTQTSFANLFATDLTKINTALENTKNLVSRKNVNFSENGKSINVKSSHKPTQKQLNALQNANKQRSTDARVREFKKAIFEAVEIRETYKLEEARRTNTNTTVSDDIRVLKETIDKYADTFFKAFIRVGNLIGVDPVELSRRFAENLKICVSTGNNEFIQQKIMNKCPEFWYAIATNKGIHDPLMRGTVVALNYAEYRNLTSLVEINSCNNKKLHITDEKRNEYRKTGGDARYSVPTSGAQSSQTKSLFRAMGLIDYIPRQRNTPITVREGAGEIIKSLADNQQVRFDKRNRTFLEA